MSSSPGSESDNSIEFEELLEFGTRCRELRKEKDMLKESQTESFELIKKLELHVKSLSEGRIKDKKRIQVLEKELMNCSQEIDYLQDQLNERNTEVNCLEEQVHSLRLTLAGMENLEDNLGWLREELHRSSSECLYLMQELVSKELELQKSNLCIEKLEESISYIALESQCEIESMKLDIMGLEQSGLHTDKIHDETVQVKARGKLFQEAELQSQNTLKLIKCLEIENKELKEKLEKSETNFRIFCRGLDKWLEMDISQFNLDSSLSELGSKLTMSKEVRDVFLPVVSKLATALAKDGDVMKKKEKMSQEIQEYELLVEQLKEELRQEKLKAREEAEDLAQEVAEVRYQFTSLLEEECKRRACIEQVSLQRIAELEAQVSKTNREKPVMLLGSYMEHRVGGNNIQIVSLEDKCYAGRGKIFVAVLNVK
ncbi:uncharacterized protein LOC107419151 isoform X2 [Ziziphus jujuba]|uniref:Protein Daple n=1 Tax=Ziziphus jujuba TaxID=326968 RepID=A0A6P6G7L1_ZIZJJ|nr:uncharacterized protein LOC107419151 isoform X2 [Ziziphus jujuba]XP_060670770.1 uncharacterized protein LOC107419151 isoform X2 [Ziziphus jujuba]